jgi:hypothetical protein
MRHITVRRISSSFLAGSRLWGSDRPVVVLVHVQGEGVALPSRPVLHGVQELIR